MSGKVSGWVWDLDLPQNEKYVLLAYADHADHEGHSIYPSVDLIVRKTGYSRRSIQRIVIKLIEKGHLVPDGVGIHGTNKYLIPIPVWGDKMTPPIGGDVKNGRGVTQLRHGGGDTATTPKPSVKRHIDPSVKRLSSNSNKEWSRFLEVFKFYVPHRPQPRATTTSLKNKLITRLKDDYFKVNYERALEIAGKSEWIAEKEFFDAEWFLKNDTNWEKCLNNKYKNGSTSRRKSQAELRQEASDKNIKDIVRNIMEDE